jgi:2-keto-3-deoxy-L-rhamnonate aldolase RhmA
MAYEPEMPAPRRPTGIARGRASALRARLRGEDLLFGAWLTTPDLSVAEIMAGAGFDFVIVDAEHSPWSVSEIQVALAAFNGSATPLLTRVPAHDSVFIKQVLDIGIDGIVCPMVHSAQEAHALVSECRYPPVGVRGFGPRRAAAYGADVDRYAREADGSVVVIPQIEDTQALGEVGEIASVEGVDALCLGPTDLSGSLGHLREFAHPSVSAAIEKVLAVAREHSKAVCTGVVVQGDEVQTWASRGARLLLVAADTGVLVNGLRAALDSARSRASSASPD